MKNKTNLLFWTTFLFLTSWHKSTEKPLLSDFCINSIWTHATRQMLKKLDL